jgi:deoxyribonuclease-2
MLRIVNLAVLGLVLFVLNRTDAIKLSCVGENGEALDWYTLYKLPRDSASTSANFLRNGTAYMYMTNLNQKWTMSKLSLADENSINGRTLNSVYYSRKNSSTCGYVVYNDQHNDRSYDSRGHTKGLVAYCDENFVHIIHSIPNHPVKERYFLNASQTVYGQSWVCATFELSQLHKLLTQVSYEYPSVLDSNLAANSGLKNGSSEHNILKSLVGGKRQTGKAQISYNFLTTAGGEKMIHFGKSSYYSPDMYMNFVANHFDKSFAVETWRNGNGGKVHNYTTLKMNSMILVFCLIIRI